MKGARPVRAPRGLELSCKGWPQEAVLRMLMNNLDPEVAERPDDLVVYGGTGRAARSWEAFDAIVRALRALEGDETLLVQSGKPVGVMRTHEWAPRVLIANSNLVPEWATWDEFRRLEDLGLTMYGQMTAGSWIYIGTQGIVQGTYECFAEIARRRYGGSLAGTITLTAGLGGMGGAQPLAVTMNGGVALCVEVDEWRIQRRLETRYLDEQAADLDDAVARCRAARDERRAVSRRAARQRGRGAAAAARGGLRGRHRHRPDERPRPARRLRAGPAVARRRPTACGATTRTSTSAARAPRWPPTARRWWASRTPAPRCSTTATRCARRRSSAASSARSTTPASCPPTCGRCSARGRARSAGSRCPATRPTSRRPTGRRSRSSPTTSGWRAGSRRRARRSRSRGCRRGSAGSATASGGGSGCASTRWWQSGELSAPIVIGRDHLDSGSVASPYRETEGMADESDAIADWPLLNALVNTPSGASWVSIHHGGGVGIGRSIHAGMVCVADGTELAAEKLDRVLTSDPGMGVIRHADAGYDRAVEVAEERGVRIPMRE